MNRKKKHFVMNRKKKQFLMNRKKKIYKLILLGRQKDIAEKHDLLFYLQT